MEPCTGPGSQVNPNLKTKNWRSFSQLNRTQFIPSTPISKIIHFSSTSVGSPNALSIQWWKPKGFCLNRPTLGEPTLGAQINNFDTWGATNVSISSWSMRMFTHETEKVWPESTQKRSSHGSLGLV
jgi:hypothetical protein